MTVSVSRDIRRGDFEKLIPATTGASAINLPNYGVTQLAASTVAEVYVLDAPEEGSRKSICITGVTTASTGVTAVTVRGSTGTSVKFGGATQTQFTVSVTSAAAPTVNGVELVGLSSTLWGVVGYSTGIVFGNT